MLTSLLSGLVLLSQGLAAYTFWTAVSQNEEIRVFFSVHGFASLLAAVWLWRWLPDQYQRPRGWGIGFLASFCFMLPFLGILGLLISLVLATRFPKVNDSLPFRSISLPRLESSGPIRLDFRLGDILDRLKVPDLANTERMKALLGVQNLPPRQANRFLREALLDPVDDIRLIAYGLLYQREKGLTATIEGTLEQLYQCHDNQGDQDSQLRPSLLSQLAYLYWEQISQELVQGDMLQYAQEKATTYANDALTLNPNEGGLWLVLGQLYTRSDQPEAARSAFQQAIEHGLPARQVTPYLADLAYRKRDFFEVQHLLHTLPTLIYDAALAPVVEFWQGEDEEVETQSMRDSTL